MPGGRRAMERPRLQPENPICLYVNAIDWCTVFKLGPDPDVGRDGTVYRDSPTAGAPTIRSRKWLWLDQRRGSENRQDALARQMAHADVRGV